MRDMQIIRFQEALHYVIVGSQRLLSVQLTVNDGGQVSKSQSHFIMLNASPNNRNAENPRDYEDGPLKLILGHSLLAAFVAESTR